MNTLITSAGRRTSLVSSFRQAVHHHHAELFAGDADGLAPALYLADRPIRLPPITDAGYIAHLLDAAASYRIQLIVPTIDTELRPLAEAAPAFTRQGCRVLVSSPELIQVAEDKWKTIEFFGARGIRVPSSWLPEQLPAASLPESLFIKPRSGSASLNAHAVHRSQIMAFLPQVDDPIIQEAIQAPEITIDALLDLNGAPLHYVPRRRLRTVGGESIQGVTLPDADLRHWILRVLDVVRSQGGVGPITLQAFLTDEGPVLSEINPRFGGGFPLTLAAGGKYPEWILDRVTGGDIHAVIGEYKVGLYMTRHYVELFVEEPLWH